MRKTCCYVAGPLNTGFTTTNLSQAFDAVTKLIEAGYEWFCPHLNIFYEACNPVSVDVAMEHDFYWLDKCDFLWRLPGKSENADKEVRRMEYQAKPVYYNFGTILTYQPKEIK